MAVFRVERTRDYTVMSNHHLKNRSLSLKAKGLLSVMLSLPDEVNEVLTPDLSKSEIQQLKEDVDEEKKITDIETMLEEKDSVQQSLDTNLEKTMYQLGKDAPEIYEKLWTSAVKNGETGKQRA